MITFFSNFINDHQIPFCEAMYKKTGGNFRFVATMEIDKERLKLGFEDKSDFFPYVVKAYEEEGKKQALKLGEESDVVIWGDAPCEFVEERLKKGKLTFKYSERYFKRGKWRILDPRVMRRVYLDDIRFKKSNLYMLCASAYTAPDCAFIGCYKNKAYKWGYFPEFKEYEDVSSLIDSKNKNSILFVGRFIRLKHPENALYVAKRLKKDGYDFTLKLIGRGELEDKIKRDIKKYGLEERVEVLGAMSPENVRKKMEQSEIFLFTSDKQEGWGAVLNESMNSACAVVANAAIGSVPYLIEDGVNGFIYKNKKELYKKVKGLLDDKAERRETGLNAYLTLKSEWNASVAADRLLTLIEKLKKGERAFLKTGPLSKG